MKSVPALFFDLDGTISDPLPGIRGAVAFALEKLHLPPVPEETIRNMIGPPLETGLCQTAGIPEPQIPEAVTLYRDYYNRLGWRENNIYPGIRELIEKAHSSGCPLALATFKPEEISKKILELFQIDRFFTEISGAEKSTDGTKRGILGHLLQKFHLHPEDTVMIGDRDKDREGAKSLSIPFLAAGWGYAAKGEFPPETEIIRSPEDLRQLLFD